MLAFWRAEQQQRNHHRKRYADGVYRGSLFNVSAGKQKDAKYGFWQWLGPRVGVSKNPYFWHYCHEGIIFKVPFVLFRIHYILLSTLFCTLMNISQISQIVETMGRGGFEGWRRIEGFNILPAALVFGCQPSGGVADDV